LRRSVLPVTAVRALLEASLNSAHITLTSKPRAALVATCCTNWKYVALCCNIAESDEPRVALLRQVVFDDEGVRPEHKYKAPVQPKNPFWSNDAKLSFEQRKPPEAHHKHRTISQHSTHTTPQHRLLWFEQCVWSRAVAQPSLSYRRMSAGVGECLRFRCQQCTAANALMNSLCAGAVCGAAALGSRRVACLHRRLVHRLESP
jgi:hypothetical protein